MKPPPSSNTITASVGSLDKLYAEGNDYIRSNASFDGMGLINAVTVEEGDEGGEVAAAGWGQVHGGAIFTLALVVLFGFVLCAKQGGYKEGEARRDRGGRRRGFRRLEEESDDEVELSGVIKD